MCFSRCGAWKSSFNKDRTPTDNSSSSSIWIVSGSLFTGYSRGLWWIDQLLHRPPLFEHVQLLAATFLPPCFFVQLLCPVICSYFYQSVELYTNLKMATIPRLDTKDISPASPATSSATASPARGREMRQTLLQKLRPPPLIHSWDFWHDRQDRTAQTAAEGGKYEDRLRHLSSISDVKAFWSTFSNFPLESLQLRDSVHLFHHGVKPIWEDPRNTRGGAWTFRVPKARAPDFWKEICMLAIGEQLQAAVESDRTTFRDDICGVSYSVRFTSALIQVWNRDADHTEGIERILKAVLEGIPEELKLKETAYYYKKHAEHSAFEARS